MGSPTVPRYLGRTTEYVATGEAGCFAHHGICYADTVPLMLVLILKYVLENEA